MNSALLERSLYVGVFLISLVLYFDAPSLVAYAFFVIATIGLLYYSIWALKYFRTTTLGGTLSVAVRMLISIFVVFVFNFIVSLNPNLCYGHAEIFAKNYFNGEVKNFHCGTVPWYYKKLEGQEAKDANLKTCNESVASDPFYQEVKNRSNTFDSLTGNFISFSQYPETPENRFGFIYGVNYGFDFSAGERTTDLSSADVVFENNKIKSTMGKSIYLSNVENKSANRGLLQEFHLQDTVSDVRLVEEVDIKDFDFAFFKTREGNFAKALIGSPKVTYQGDTTLEYSLSILWAYQPNGTRSLKSDYTNLVKDLETRCEKFK